MYYLAYGLLYLMSLLPYEVIILHFGWLYTYCFIELLATERR